MYINPNECIDCGACEPVCPVTAISSDLRIAADLLPWRDDNATFFDQPLPGRDEPLGSPGSAGELGKVDADAPLAAVTPATAAAD
jgi:Fe-S-cluster-containing hydrogenase component 2